MEYTSGKRPAWTSKDIKRFTGCPNPSGAPNQDMLDLVDFRLAVQSDDAARRLKLPQDAHGRQQRTEMRWAWLRVDKSTGVGWVRVVHIYSPLEYTGDWESWFAAHGNEFTITGHSTWVPLPEFVAHYTRFQRKPKLDALGRFPAYRELGPFYRSSWWKDSWAPDSNNLFVGTSERGEAGQSGDSCQFDKFIWAGRVELDDPERMLDPQAAYDEWWRVFG